MVFRSDGTPEGTRAVPGVAPDESLVLLGPAGGRLIFVSDQGDELTRKYDATSVLGTADYLAPEQAINSHEADIRADVYSLGATFYFLLVGKSPFQEGTVAQKLIWHQIRQPTPIPNLRPEVPEALVAIIDKMMAKDPAQRPQAPQEVADALIPFTEQPIAPPSEDEMPRLSPAASGDQPLQT